MPLKGLFFVFCLCDRDGGRDATIVPNTDDMQCVDMETMSARSPHSPAFLIKYAFLATVEETVIFPKCLQSSCGPARRRPGGRWRRIEEDRRESAFDLARRPLRLGRISASKCVCQCVNVSARRGLTSKPHAQAAFVMFASAGPSGRPRLTRAALAGPCLLQRPRVTTWTACSAAH